VVVGSMAFDDLEFPAPFVAEPGSEPKRQFDDVIGGSATYAALSASCLAAVRAVAVVGDDFPADTLARLEERAVDVEGVERVPGRTFRWRGRYLDDLSQRETLDTQLNVFADFRPKLPARYCDAAIVLLGNIHPVLQLEVLDRMTRPELVVADTMNFWIEREPEALARVLARTDALIINDEEARLLSGVHNLAKAARDILARGPKRLVVKRGEYGSLFFDRDGVFAAPALLLEEVVDPTGAGDSFAGGLVGYLATVDGYDHHTMRRAMVYGTATASFCVEALGTSALWSLDGVAVTRRVEAIRDLFHIGEPL
jgi:sugar/nucleoside kinase (ribokinase family)